MFKNFFLFFLLIDFVGFYLYFTAIHSNALHKKIYILGYIYIFKIIEIHYKIENVNLYFYVKY